MTDQTYPHLQQPVVLEEGLTFDEYFAKYEGQNTEWHAGKVVQKVSNNTQHQFISLFLTTLLTLYLSSVKVGKLLVDGVPMYISDDVPARQPDLMVIFNDKLDNIKPTRFEGPADIVIEIVSPSSGAEDRGVKFLEYESAGVTEYWLIDPIREEADIYALQDGETYKRLPEHPQGHIRSSVLEKFVLESSILWQDDLPAGIEILPLVQAMLDD